MATTTNSPKPYVRQPIVNELRRTMRKWAGIDITPAQVREYLSMDRELEAKLSGDYGPRLNTAERERFLDLLAYKIAGSAFWPSHNDNKAFRTFLDRFRLWCLRADIKVEPMENRKRKRPRGEEVSHGDPK